MLEETYKKMKMMHEFILCTCILYENNISFHIKCYQYDYKNQSDYSSIYLISCSLILPLRLIPKHQVSSRAQNSKTKFTAWHLF